MVGGGARLYSSFLAEGMADEIVLNIEPAVTNTALAVGVETPLHADLKLLGTSSLASDVCQLHYAPLRR